MKTSASTFWDFGSIPMIEPEFLGNILATSSDIAVMIDLKGSIKSVLVNQSEQYYGDLSHWEGKNITKFLTMDSIPKLERALDKLNSGQTILHSIELNHQDNAKWQFPVRYNAHLVGQNDNILLLGRDLRSISETQQQLVKAQIAVEQSHEERKEYDAHYRSIFSTANEPIFVLDAKTGKIRQANPAACTLLGEDIDRLLTEPFGKFVGFKDKKDLTDRMAMAAMSKTTLKVVISHNGQDTEAILYTVIYRASGQQVLLVRLNLEKNRANLNDPLSKNLISLYKNGTDGIVFTNASGVISYVNESFLELLNTARGAEIVGRSLGDFLSKGQIDLAVMLENVHRAGQMRIYSTDLKNDFGLKTAVEVSMTKISSDTSKQVSFVIRETSRAEPPGPMRPAIASNDNNPSIAELVGSASLKEIVAETTDVIEKICIQTAVETTNNNKAAAAEMLGLSRQSLYVKLHKYGLVDTEVG
jgi:transcriptional regulator PpsR